MPRRPRLPRPSSLVPSRAALKAIVGGLLVAAALPPWGFWPLAFVGIAIYETSAESAETGRQRLARGWLFGAAWLFPGMCWMWFLTAPGYLLAAAMFAGFHAVAAWAAPRGSWRVIGRPVAHTLAEALRFCFPFGGVPLASLAIGQAAGPFATVVRVGGVVLLTWFVFQIGFALSGPSPFVPQMVRSRRPNAKGEWHGVTGFLVALMIWLVAAPFATGEIFADEAKAYWPRVAAVQGGGPQGTHAVDNADDEQACRDAGGTVCTAFDRHLQATRSIEAGSVDFVVWPENVVDVDTFVGSTELELIAEQAKRLDAPFAVGITEEVQNHAHFTNAEVIVTPDGEVTSRYEKVRRVPFGEYMPLRGLLHALGAPTDLVPRDAVAGKGPAVLELPDGIKVATVISWEVFFGGRANEGVEAGGQLIINPTNGSSYTWTVLQNQQVASSRLRAIEQNRWVVQASPTGFSAFISPEGDVYQRTGVSEQRVIIRSIELRGAYRTWYSHTGDLPWVALMLLVFMLATWRARVTRPAEPDEPSAQQPTE